MSNHDFCRTLLRLTREEAKEHGVAVPKRITALGSDKGRQWFVEMEGRTGEYVSADCAYNAKAKFIQKLIEKHMEGKL